MRILLTNDDGILAPGLAAMFHALASHDEVCVVAPESPQSAAGHSITIERPLVAKQVHAAGDMHGWAVDGSPADCVKLAIAELLGRRPDLVVSGINDGANAGINILYSGTVAAAAEGAFFGIPAVAVSLTRSAEMDFALAARLAATLIRQIVAAGLLPGELINMNLPALDAGRPRGVRVVAQSTRAHTDSFQRFELEDGRVGYFLREPKDDASHEPDTDVEALRERFITLTPLRLDFTDEARQPHWRSVRWQLDML